MNDRTDTKNTRFSRQDTAIFSTWARVFVVSMAGILLVPAAGQSAAASMPGQELQSLRPEVGDVLESYMRELLRIWAQFIGCGTPYGQQSAVWLTDFNACWGTSGLPDNLTESDRKEMTVTLDRLEAHLRTNPGEVAPALYEQTLATIAEARFELNTPVPAPVPAIVTSELAGGSDGGGR